MTEHVSEPPTDTIVVPIWLDEGAYRRLQHLADAMSRTRGGGVFSVERILDELIDHVDQAIWRPGSWEAGAFASVFGDDALARAYEAMYAAGDEPR